MNLLSTRDQHHIEIIEPNPDDCETCLPPEGNVKLGNYRLLSENLRAYTPTGDINTSPEKRKLVSRFDFLTTISPPRQRILELLRPDDPGRDALEAIVRPAPRRGLSRPLDEDTRRFLQRALLSPSPQGSSTGATPEPTSPEPHKPEQTSNTNTNTNCLKKQRSLADELREAEEGPYRKEMSWLGDIGIPEEAAERDRLGRLALAVEEDEEDGLAAAARRLDALLAESRDLHAELAGIQQDLQVLARRVRRDT